MAIDWHDLNYQKRQVILLDPPGANLSDFPALLKLTDSEQVANADMASKRYAVYDWLGNELPYEEEAYSEGTYANFETWCKVPDLYASPSGDQNKVVVYYDYDPGSDQDDAANVWDANFLFVGHMNDASSGAQDSTGYGNHFAQGSAPAYQQTGKVGFGQTFTSDYHYRNSAIVSGVPLTVSALVKPPDTATYYEVIALGDTNGLQSFELLLRGPSVGDPVSARTYAGTWDQAVTSSGFVAGTWQHVAAVFAATNDRRAYLNGGSKGTNNTNLTPSGLDNSRIGRLNYNSQSYFTYSGDLDEVRISDTVRSDDWIAYEYHNVADADNAQTWGGEETQSVTYNLTANDATHAHAAGSPSLTELHELIAAACTHAHAAGEPLLSRPSRAPYRVVAGQVSHTGAAAAGTFSTGARAGDVFHTGTVAGQVI